MVWYATFCQSTVLVSYVILMILNHKNMTIVISSTVVATISCIMCLTTPEGDDNDDLIEVIDIMVIAPETITIQINDENVYEIETPALEQTVVQINHDSFDDPNTPQAVMVATVVPRQCH